PPTAHYHLSLHDALPISSHEKTMATSEVTRVPATSPRRSTMPPRATISRQTSLSVPACGSIAEWNFSLPCTDARHWKKHTPSAPDRKSTRLNSSHVKISY